MRFGKNEKISYSLFGIGLLLWIVMSIWELPWFVGLGVLTCAMLGFIFKLRSNMEADDKGAEYRRQKSQEEAIAERLANQKKVHKVPSKKRRKLK